MILRSANFVLMIFFKIFSQVKSGRLSLCLEEVRANARMIANPPVNPEWKVHVCSENNFPTAAGWKSTFTKDTVIMFMDILKNPRFSSPPTFYLHFCPLSDKVFFYFWNLDFDNVINLCEGKIFFWGGDVNYKLLYWTIDKRGREHPDAISLRHADTSLPYLLGRPSLHYADHASALQTVPPLCSNWASTIQHSLF